MSDGGELTSGLCPLCDAEFHDRAAFREHLAADHGLEDDEGTETDFIPPLLGPKPELAGEPEPEPETPAPVAAEPAGATTPAAPAGAVADDDATGHRKAIVLVASLLVAAIGGSIALAGSGRGPGHSDRGNLATAEANVRTTAVAAPPTTVAAVAASTPPTVTTAAPAPTAPPSTPAPDASATTAPPIDATPVSEPSAPPPPPPDSPTTEPFAPPLVFSPPTTAGATRDSCTRDKGRWVVTYRWQFVGGSGWSPSSEYVSLGGGWYQHTLSVKNGSTITAVLVTDPNGVQYSVNLDPPVSTSGC